MIHWNRKRYRSLLIIQICFLFVCTTAMIASLSDLDSIQGSDHQGLEIVRSETIDLQEISGLGFLPEVDGKKAVVAVGDKAPVLAMWMLDDWDVKTKKFSAPLIENFSLCRSFEQTRCKKNLSAITQDWEAITSDASGSIFLIQEHSESLIVMNPALSEIQTVINYSFSKAFPSVAKSSKKFRTNAMAEGIILLKNGHFILAKESYPAALVEFGPVGSNPQGLSAATLLQAGEIFAYPSKAQGSPTDNQGKIQRLEYTALHSWLRAGQSKCDISDIASSPSGKLFIMSQNCGQIGVRQGLSLKKRDLLAEKSFSFPRSVRNPEAMLVLSENELLVGSDTKKSGPNMFHVRLPKASVASSTH